MAKWLVDAGNRLQDLPLKKEGGVLAIFVEDLDAKVICYIINSAVFGLFFELLGRILDTFLHISPNPGSPWSHWGDPGATRVDF